MSSLTKILKALVLQAAVKVRDISELHFKGEFCCCCPFSWALLLTPAVGVMHWTWMLLSSPARLHQRSSHWRWERWQSALYTWISRSQAARTAGWRAVAGKVESQLPGASASWQNKSESPCNPKILFYFALISSFSVNIILLPVRGPESAIKLL